MPRLLLLRHAKAENAGKGGGSDHERALSERGRKEAAEIGRLMVAHGEAIEVVLCSTSLRTRQTWELVEPALPGSPDVRFLRGIYTAENTYLDILHEEAGDAGSVLLIGHNPTIQNTALGLVPEGGSGGQPSLSDFPTGALAILTFDGAWPELAPGRAQLAGFLTPREAKKA